METKTIISKNETNIIKGIGISLIILSHIGGNLTRIFTPLGGIGVALFLFVSAFGIEKSFKKNGFKNFWIKRFSTIIIPYIIFECITLFTLYPNKVTALDILFDFTLIKPLHMHGWYLHYLLIWYILFYIINSISIFKNNDRYSQIAFIVCGFVMAGCYVADDGVRFEQSFVYPAGVILAIYDNNRLKSQTITKENHKQKVNNNCIKVISIIALLIFSICVLAIKQLPQVRNTYLFVRNIMDLFIKNSAAIAIILFIMLMKKYKDKKIIKISNNVISYIGGISFEIYLVHGYVLKLIYKCNNIILGLLVFAIVTFTISFVFNKMNNKISQLILKGYK